MDWKRIFGRGEPVALHPAGQGRWTSGSAACASGTRKFRLWVPASYDPRVPSPLVMMLHGCRQKSEELAETSGMNAVAQKNNLLVVYPEQPIRANLLRCWNWFETKHQSRGAGEPAILAAVVEQVRSSHSVDPKRVYAAGISAGAAMAVILGATYPDIFAAIGAVAGLEFRAANGLIAGLSAMKYGGPDPNQQGAAAFQAMSSGLGKDAKQRMPIIVFHGNADSYVNPVSAHQLITQWAVTNHLLHGNKYTAPDTAGELTNGSVAGGYAYHKYTYKDAAGRLLMEKWMVEGLGHAWPGSPVSGPYADPQGPKASEEMWRFFSQTTAEPFVAPTGLRALWGRSVGLLNGAVRFASELLGGKHS